MTDSEEPDSPDEIELMRTVASRIRLARLNANLTQQEVADKASLKRAYVYELERGTANTTLKMLARVARALNLKASDLLPQSETPRMTRQDVQALFDALMDLEVNQRAIYEAALNESLASVEGFRKRLGRMLPLDPHHDEGPPPSQHVEASAHSHDIKGRNTTGQRKV